MWWRLELDHLSLTLLVTTQFEMFATFDWCLFAVLALSTFHTQHDFLGGLCLEISREKTIWIRIESIKNAGFIELLPSFWRLVWFDHRNLVVYGHNDDDPVQPNVPSTSCIVSLCAICDICIFCKKCAVVLVRSPKLKPRINKKHRLIRLFRIFDSISAIIFGIYTAHLHYNKHWALSESIHWNHHNILLKKYLNIVTIFDKTFLLKRYQGHQS